MPAKVRLPLWALIWIALVLGALVVFLANQTAVDRLLAVTGLEKVLYPGGKASGTLVMETPASVVLVDPAPQTPSAAPPAPEVEEDLPAPEPAAEPPVPAAPNTYRLYFLKLTPEGRMEPASFVRELPAGTTPLTATLKALLLGPTLQDKAQGALTMIPEGTKLLSLRLKERTALVSLSAEFEHNPSGPEGLAGQLREVVWTATQFGTVDSVQILIEGQYRDTLGESGIPVSEPLTRSTVP